LGTTIVKAIWLVLSLAAIGTFHAALYFLIYPRESEGSLVFLWLLAFLLYFVTLYVSLVFRKAARFRVLKLMSLSLLFSFISTSAGVFCAFNTYGT
jgi:hypothetical protein